ncbi:hypothetical protein DNTS_024622 [Danionella cerebrum]|uniref:Selenoprotein H n=1 Tax=Danionella cerebrum TaxID=2873325 RepID=A0A553NHQ5_9TELE|nr:hypothetical protein DNTS_024622 [Danionella translucida]
MATRGKSARGRKRKPDADLEAAAVEEKKEKLEDEEDEGKGQRLRVLLNPQKPRRNSFEITLVEEGNEIVLWTGIKKGPPRKLKFPEPSEVVSALTEALKSG